MTLLFGISNNEYRILNTEGVPAPLYSKFGIRYSIFPCPEVLP